MPLRTKQKRSRNARKHKKTNKSRSDGKKRNGKKYWHFVKDAAVCRLHNCSVCNICRMDFSVFNTIVTTTKTTFYLCQNACIEYYTSDNVMQTCHRRTIAKSHLYKRLLTTYAVGGTDVMSLDDATCLVGLSHFAAGAGVMGLPNFLCSPHDVQEQTIELLYEIASIYICNVFANQLKMNQQIELTISQLKYIFPTSFGKRNKNIKANADSMELPTIAYSPIMADRFMLHADNMMRTMAANFYTSEELGIFMIDVQALSDKLIPPDSKLEASKNLKILHLCERDEMLFVYKEVNSFAMKYACNEIPSKHTVKSWNDGQIADFLISKNICRTTSKFTNASKIKLILEFIDLQNTALLYNIALSVGGKESNDRKFKICIDGYTGIPNDINPSNLSIWSNMSIVDPFINSTALFSMDNVNVYINNSVFSKVQKLFHCIAAYIEPSGDISEIPTFIICEKGDNYAITINVSSIKAYNSESTNQISKFTPIIFVEWCEKNTRINPHINVNYVWVTVDRIEVELLSELLKQNRKKISSSFVKEFESKCPKGSYLSLLMPHTISDTGEKLCPICHSLGTKRCSGCNIVYYCTRKCQKRHWSKHKEKCNLDCRQHCKSEL